MSFTAEHVKRPVRNIACLTSSSAAAPSATAAPLIVAEAGHQSQRRGRKGRWIWSGRREAGADAVKFQTFKADEFVGDPEQTYTYRSQGKDVTESMLAMFRRYELPREDWFAIKAECDRQNIIFPVDAAEPVRPRSPARGRHSRGQGRLGRFHQSAAVPKLCNNWSAAHPLMRHGRHGGSLPFAGRGWRAMRLPDRPFALHFAISDPAARCESAEAGDFTCGVSELGR